MLRSLVAGTVVALILAPAASWSKDPPQQIEVERTGHILQPKLLDPHRADIGKLKLPEGFHIAKFADGLIRDDPALIYTATPLPCSSSSMAPTGAETRGQTQGVARCDAQTCAGPGRPGMHLPEACAGGS